MIEAADGLRILVDWPRPGVKVKAAIADAAKLAKLEYWRAFDIWYRKARRIETYEAEQIEAALQRKNETEAKNEIRELRLRLDRLERLLASTDADFHRPSIDAAREQAGRLGGADSRRR